MSSDAIRDILIQSHIVIGLWSTVMLDAVILGKPSVQAIIGKNMHMFQNPYDGMFPTVNTVVALQEILTKCDSQGCAISDNAKEKTFEYIQGLDGLACKRICKAIRELV
jgi:hypothetical protein